MAANVGLQCCLSGCQAWLSFSGTPHVPPEDYAIVGPSQSRAHRPCEHPCKLFTMASGLLLHTGSTCLLRRAVKEPARCSSSPAAAAVQPAVCSVPAQPGNLRPCFQGQSLGSSRSSRRQQAQRSSTLTVYAIKDGATLDRPLRVAVVGGGPGGASCAHTLAENGIETFLFERKMDNCKVCPGCMPCTSNYAQCAAS